MKNYLALWKEDLIDRASFQLKKTIQVTGERDTHLGPAWEKFKVQVTLHPATAFEVVDCVKGDECLKRLLYPEWVVFGLLDVLMVGLPAPLRDVRICLENVEYDPVYSSPMALRQAGRDAGRKIVDVLHALK